MIVPKSRTISDLFNESIKLVVPKYQRNFDWGKNEVQELMIDLKESREDNCELYLGNFVFDTNKNDEYRIVDGQQRITTISILLIACREKAKQLGETKLAYKIHEKIEFTDDTTGKTEAVRVIVSPTISDVFNYISNSDWDGEFPLKINGKGVKKQSNKIKPIYKYMLSQLEDFDADELSEFLNVLYKKTYVIILTIEKESEAFELFERTNARGLDLNVADLLKNYLFKNVEEEEIEESWDQIVEFSDNTLQRMIKYFWVSYKGYTSKSDLYKKLKEYGDEIGAEQLTERLYNFSEYYHVARSLDANEIRDWLGKIECDELAKDEGHPNTISQLFESLKLFNITQAYPLIYSIFTGYRNSDRNIKVLLKLLKNIENYHFVNNMICDRIGNEVEKKYAEFCVKFINTDDFYKTTQEFISILIEKKASKEEFESRFVELDYESTSTSIFCYIFDRLNNYKFPDSQRQELYNSNKKILINNYNVEHIMPRKPDFKVAKETLDIVHNIGNLLVISRHLNSKLQNKKPIDKIKILKAEGINHRYISDFIKEYEDKAGDWNDIVIGERAKELSSKGYDEIWQLYSI